MVGRLSIIILCTLIICGTQTRSASSSDTGRDKHTADALPVQDTIAAGPVRVNAEYMDFDSVSINGELPWITTSGALYGLLGQPDSIVPVNSDEGCGYYFSDDDLKIAHLKGIQVQIIRDSAVIGTLSFRERPEVFLKTPRITLSHNTALSDIARVFPRAFKEQSVLDVHDIGKAITIRLETGEKIKDDAWLLFFQDGKLVRIDYWLPC